VVTLSILRIIYHFGLSEVLIKVSCVCVRRGEFVCVHMNVTSGICDSNKND
jgi:hypothetical protein